MQKANDDDRSDDLPLVWWGILIASGIAYAVWNQSVMPPAGINVAQAIGILTGLLGIPFVITLAIHRFDFRRADERGFLLTFTIIYLIILALNVVSTLNQ